MNIIPNKYRWAIVRSLIHSFEILNILERGLLQVYAS